MKMCLQLKILILIICGLTSVVQAQSHKEIPLPTHEQMQSLRPQPGLRLKTYDSLFPRVANSANANQDSYSAPEQMQDLQERLQRIKSTGNPDDFFTAQEQIQYHQNLQELKNLEADFFKKLHLSISMGAAILMQKTITLTSSPQPKAQKQERLIEFWRQNHEKNILYANWDKAAPLAQAQIQNLTWGNVLTRFNQDESFRESWIQQHPETLPQLKAMAEVWAWDDPTVTKVHVLGQGTPHEHWLLERTANSLPNRFELKLKKDFTHLAKLEFSSTLYFNRLTRITQNGHAITYHLVPVEKGRSMEPMDHFNESGTDKTTFRGAEFIRKSKADEFPQRNLVNDNSLGLFLGLRTMPIHEARQLMLVFPELMLAAGNVGFSVTGGLAQTTSNRTDGVQAQAPKLAATLIDAIHFARTTDVKTWFKNNSRHVLRTIFGGVGAGGHQGLAEPGKSQQKKTTTASPHLLCAHVWL